MRALHNTFISQRRAASKSDIFAQASQEVFVMSHVTRGRTTLAGILAVAASIVTGCKDTAEWRSTGNNISPPGQNMLSPGIEEHREDTETTQYGGTDVGVAAESPPSVAEQEEASGKPILGYNFSGGGRLPSAASSRHQPSATRMFSSSASMRSRAARAFGPSSRDESSSARSA